MTKAEWFTDCVHCLREVDSERYAIVTNHDLSLVGCAHLACEAAARRELARGAQLLIKNSLLKPCPPELAAYLAGRPKRLGGELE